MARHGPDMGVRSVCGMGRARAAITTTPEIVISLIHVSSKSSKVLALQLVARHCDAATPPLESGTALRCDPVHG